MGIFNGVLRKIPWLRGKEVRFQSENNFLAKSFPSSQQIEGKKRKLTYVYVEGWERTEEANTIYKLSPQSVEMT